MPSSLGNAGGLSYYVACVFVGFGGGWLFVYPTYEGGIDTEEGGVFGSLRVAALLSVRCHF